MLAETQSQRADAVARENKLIASAQATEDKLLVETKAQRAEAVAREHALVQMKASSEKLQAEFASKREHSYMDSELKRQKLAMEKDVASSVTRLRPQ